jgi:hypothetical protein
VWIDSGFFFIYPNLYIILVGEPAGGKTTAMDIARRMVQRLDIVVAPSASTKEAVTQLMSSENENSPCSKTFTFDGEPRIYTHLSMFASEIVTTLAAGGNPQGFIEFLTDIWDRELFEYKTKHGGTDIIQGPYITMLGCMTPEQTDQMLKQSIITGGFSRRCIFVYSMDRGAPVPRPVLTNQQKQCYNMCLKHAKKVQQRSGEFKQSDNAIEYFDKWYYKNYERRGQPMPAVLKNYLRSKDQLIWKTSMLIALAEDADCELVVKVHHLEQAIQMLDEIEPFIVKVFEGTGRNVLADIAAQIVSMLEQAKQWVPMKKVYATMFDQGDRDEIAKAIHHLVESDRVVKASYHGVAQVMTTTELAKKLGMPK